MEALIALIERLLGIVGAEEQRLKVRREKLSFLLEIVDDVKKELQQLDNQVYGITAQNVAYSADKQMAKSAKPVSPVASPAPVTSPVRTPTQTMRYFSDPAFYPPPLKDNDVMMEDI